MSNDPNQLVRCTYAECIYSLGNFYVLDFLAEISVRFLDLSQTFRDLVPQGSDEDEMFQVSMLLLTKDSIL